MTIVEPGSLAIRIRDGLSERTRGAGPQQTLRRTAARAAQPSFGVETLAARHAVREFSHTPLELDTLQRVLERGTATAHALWPSGDHEPALALLLAVRRITELEPGLYAWRHDEPLTAVGAAESWPTVLASLEDSYSDAPVTVLVCADLSKAVADGACGYAATLVRAGALGYAVWLAGVEAGLAGCVYGAPHADAGLAARTMDPASGHLLSASLGEALDSGTPAGPESAQPPARKALIS